VSKNGLVYHHCGFPLWAQTEWNGMRYVTRRYRVYETRRALTKCPKCGERLRDRDADWIAHPPVEVAE